MRSFLATLFAVFVLSHPMNAQDPLKPPPAPEGKPRSASVAPLPPDSEVVPFSSTLFLKKAGLKSTAEPGFRLGFLEGKQQLSPSPLHREGRRRPKEPSGATVEVWDSRLPESPKEERFRANIEALKKSLAVAMRTPPPRYGALDLATLMLSDPGQPQALELAKVRSIHLRFNRLPPNRTLPR